MSPAPNRARSSSLREDTIGYVSQFLRTIPRVSRPRMSLPSRLIAHRARCEAEGVDRARALLARLNVPERLWTLPPATFSGGEQQRVNIARGFIAHYPILLLGRTDSFARRRQPGRRGAPGGGKEGSQGRCDGWHSPRPGCARGNRRPDHRRYVLCRGRGRLSLRNKGNTCGRPQTVTEQSPPAYRPATLATKTIFYVNSDHALRHLFCRRCRRSPDASSAMPGWGGILSPAQDLPQPAIDGMTTLRALRN